MLVTLAIRNLAIIDEAVVELGPGMNAITGETGAGKSILIGALDLVLGGRAKTGAVRRGADRAEVSALFRVPAEHAAAIALRELDLVDPEDAGGKTIEILVRRVVAPKGKGRVYINGRLSTVHNLEQIAGGLVDITSQHQSTQLLDARQHLRVLDAYGELGGQRAAFEATFRAWRRAIAARDTLQTEADERLRREDFVRFQRDEIDAVQPVPGEDEALVLEAARLKHGDELASGARRACVLMQERSGVDERLREASRLLEGLSTIDPEIAPHFERLEAARIELDDIGFDLGRYADGVEVDPRRLDQVSERLHALEKLKRKHGADLGEVIAARDRMVAELARFESLDQAIADAEAEVSARHATAWEAASNLSDARKRAAGKLTQRVTPELHDLAMRGAQLRFELSQRDTLNHDGCDGGEIVVETNKGEGFSPLARTASGGELSRILLALKRSLMHLDPVDTCIFDEIDSGTGGAVADTIGQKLAQVAADRQVIVITHLAQIAARATTHLKVDKRQEDGRTVTHIRGLSAAERQDEIARMLGGIAITDRIRAHAAELLILRG